ncbi:hypothetical protein E0668_23620 [Salmonella enterica subsp. enterica]|nr:hypothetical protein [Salmonella enterica subsp. enterica serovar Paratyphi A]
MAQRAVQWEEYKDRRRDEKAAKWREARARMFSYGDNIRPILRKLWNECPYPGDPGYLLGFLHSYDVGRIDPENPPWVYRGNGLKDFDILEIINRSRERMGMLPVASFDELPSSQYGKTPALMPPQGDQDERDRTRSA